MIVGEARKIFLLSCKLHPNTSNV